MFEKKKSIQENPKTVKLQLHKEELEINKNKIETASVQVYKKIYTEEKKISVPVTREELIIEKKNINDHGKIETIRIPLSEERIQITKHPVILENVEIYKNEIEEIVHINEILKEEKARIETTGDIQVLEEDNSFS